MVELPRLEAASARIVRVGRGRSMVSSRSARDFPRRNLLIFNQLRPFGRDFSKFGGGWSQVCFLLTHKPSHSTGHGRGGYRIGSVYFLISRHCLIQSRAIRLGMGEMPNESSRFFGFPFRGASCQLARIKPQDIASNELHGSIRASWQLAPRKMRRG